MLTDVVDYGTGVRRASRATAWPARRARRPSSTPRRQLLRPKLGKCEYQTSFVGFAPAKHPRFVALVMVDEPQAPGDDRPCSRAATVAAPAFKHIAQGILQVLHVPADRPRELGH